MSVDFNQLKHFSMTYVFLDGEETACEFEQTEQKPVVAPDNLSTRFSLRNIDQNEDQETYTIELIKNDDDDYFIKSDYFVDAEEPYSLDVELTGDDVRFILEDKDEVMYLYGFFA
jgi:hypothetical protein